MARRLRIAILMLLLRAVSAEAGWERLSIPTGADLTSVAFPTPTQGWVASEDGALWHTSDGGVTWAPQYANPEVRFRDLDFCDSLHGWAVGYSRPDSVGFGVSLLTADGGRTWTGFARDHEDIYLVSCRLVSPRVGWAARNVVDNAHQFYYGTVCGLALQPQTQWTMASFVEVDAVDSLTAFAGAWSYMGFGGVQMTFDGGINWSGDTSGLFAVQSLDFVDRAHGWLVDRQNVVWNSTDSGFGWTPQCTLDLYGGPLVFVDSLNGWILYDNSVLRTRDGGRHWTEEPVPLSEGLYAGFARDTLNCWVVGSRGGIARFTSYTPVGETPGAPPARPRMTCCPNPSAGPVRIGFSGVAHFRSTLVIHDATGARVWQTEVAPGADAVVWNSECPPGIYFARLVEAGVGATLLRTR